MIELHKTQCDLLNGEVGKVCKELLDQKYLVCTKKNWYICSTEYIIKYEVKVNEL